MVNKGATPARRRRLAPEARRLEILDAAEQMIRRHGSAVRVEDVARAAGAAKGTIFAYFPTFDDLLDEIRARQVAPLEAQVAELVGPQSAIPWPTLLPAIATLLVEFMLSLEGLHEVLFHSAFARHRPLPSERRPAARIAELLRAGQAAGAFAPLDPEPTAVLLFAIIHETADAIGAGADHTRALAAMREMIDRTVLADPHSTKDTR